jgi:hypothetical protein
MEILLDCHPRYTLVHAGSLAFCSDCAHVCAIVVETAGNGQSARRN